MPDYHSMSATLEYLSEHSEALIKQVVDRQCAASRIRSDAARLRCLEDNRFHLHYLTASISAGNPSIFSDYCGWVKVVLQTRGIAVSHFESNLKEWRDWLLASSPERIAEVVVGYLDVALQRLPQYPDEPPTVMTSNPQTPLISQYLERLIALDSDGAVQLIESKATDAASVLDLYFNVLQPAQREIGRLWQVNSISVALEHYATATAQRILHVLSRKVPTGTNGHTRFLALCPEGEHHCVGLEMVCNLCSLKGWQSHFVGANTPTASALTLALQMRPHVIGISLTTLLALEPARILIAKVKESLPDSVVVVGGYAASLGKDVWKSVGADKYAADGVAALAIIEQILANDGGLRQV
jgi:MerR family transcriptional regulator, light-induced transcriptional regulator